MGYDTKKNRYLYVLETNGHEVLLLSSPKHLSKNELIAEVMKQPPNKTIGGEYIEFILANNDVEKMFDFIYDTRPLKKWLKAQMKKRTILVLDKKLTLAP